MDALKVLGLSRNGRNSSKKLCGDATSIQAQPKTRGAFTISKFIDLCLCVFLNAPVNQCLWYSKHALVSVTHFERNYIMRRISQPIKPLIEAEQFSNPLINGAQGVDGRKFCAPSTQQYHTCFHYYFACLSSILLRPKTLSGLLKSWYCFYFLPFVKKHWATLCLPLCLCLHGLCLSAQHAAKFVSCVRASECALLCVHERAFTDVCVFLHVRLCLVVPVVMPYLGFVVYCRNWEVGGKWGKVF